MVFYRRKLPHWQPAEAALFVTWRLYGSLPTAARQTGLPGKASARVTSAFPSAVFLADDVQLDREKVGPLWLKEPRIATIVVQALHFGEAELQLYGLCSWVVMPNHVHVLLWPHSPLEKITRAVKGFTARQANKLLGRTGKRFWQEESFDHWIRTEEEFQRVAAYIENNPVSAGLVKNPQDWPWSSTHL